MEIRTVNKSKLNPALYNPRKDLKPGDIEYEKLKKSILAFGEVDPIIWNEKTGNIVGGHQRFKVLRDIGQGICIPLIRWFKSNPAAPNYLTG